MYTQILIYPHILLVHSCTTGIGAHNHPDYYGWGPGPTSTRMSHSGGTSHGSHGQSLSHADGSRQSRTWRGWVALGSCRVPVPRLQSWSTGTPPSIGMQGPIHARNHMRGPAQLRPSSGMCLALAVPVYWPGTQGRSIIGNNWNNIAQYAE